MKRLLAIAIILGSVMVVNAQDKTPLTWGIQWATGPSLVYPPAPSAARIIIGQDVDDPNNLYSGLIKTMVDLAALNDPKVDAVLSAHKIQITDKDGKQLFPRDRQ
jgi:hypothetical protein